MSFTERRRALRFDLNLPVTIRWNAGAGMEEAVTVSENVSSHGIYFSLSQRIESGTTVELEMILPNQITLAGPVRVRCFGRIRRCTDQDAKAAMAAEIEKYEFLPDNDEASAKVSG